jgi:hypothetical protein
MKSISPHFRTSSPRVPSPFRVAIVLPSVLERIVFQASFGQTQSLASVSFSLKQPSADIRGTTRLTALRPTPIAPQAMSAVALP